jgi:DNA-binding LacI/PurR family transcriptional regulator
LKKYKRLVLAYPKCPQYPEEIVTGFRAFCMQNNFRFTLINEITAQTEIQADDAYIVIEETDLVELIKKCQSMGLQPGKEVGIISYNDTPLKEILLDGITVISTDHAKMGEMAARLILENKKEKIRNPFSLIIRKSL